MLSYCITPTNNIADTAEKFFRFVFTAALSEKLPKFLRFDAVAKILQFDADAKILQFDADAKILLEVFCKEIAED